MAKTPKRPRDTMDLARLIGEIATKEKPDPLDTAPTPAQDAATRRGNARAAKLSPGERKAIAKKAATARWKGGKK